MEPIAYNFGEKHIAYMKRARCATVNVAEGAVRSGKTVDNLFVFAYLLDCSPDRVHLATGATKGSAKIILGDGGGFGLEHQFAGRCHWGTYHDADALFVKTPVGERIVLFYDAGHADAYKKIRGFGIGMWIATEINLHHPTMIREAFSRQTAATDRRVFWDLNPEAPGAPIYRDYLDRFASGMTEGRYPESFYNYAHFTMYDNAAISPKRLAEIEAQYEVGSLWYRRDILGERCAAEGMVYPRFADDPAAFTVSRAEVGVLSFITVGVDFGGNRSKTTFVAVGFSPGFRTVTALCDDTLDNSRGEVTGDEVNRALIRFLERVTGLYPGVPLRYVFCDSEAQYLIHGLKRALGEERTIKNPHNRTKVLAPKIMNAAKHPIHERIFCETSLFAEKRLFVTEDCPHLTAGLSAAVWDESREEDIRLDNFTSDIDILDAFEYAFEPYIPKLWNGEKEETGKNQKG